MDNGSHYSYEDLDVWHKSVDFADMVIGIVDELNTDRKHYRLIEQVESAATSVSMNIAEGKGRFSKKEFVRFLYIARGSLFETITLIEILKRRNWINDKKYQDIRQMGNKIGKMLSGLIASIKRSISNEQSATSNQQ